MKNTKQPKTEKLIRVRTYANSINKSTAWVYQLISKGELKSTEIDGVKFVIMQDK